MKLLISLIIFNLSTISFAGQTKSPKELISEEMFIELKLEYIKNVKKLVKEYNKNRKIDKKKYKKKMSALGFSVSSKTIPKKLPKMVINKSGLEITKLGFRYDFKSWLYGVVKINNQMVVLDCQKRINCFTKLLENSRKRVSWLNLSLINEAHASDDELALLLEEDHLVLGAMLLIDEEMQELPFWTAMAVGQAEKRNIVTSNIARLYKNIEKQADECESWQRDVANGYGEHNTQISRYSFTTMANTLKKMVEFEDFAEMQDELSSYIGDKVFDYSELRTTFTDNQDWAKYLKCEYIPGVNKSITEGEFATDAFGYVEHTGRASLRTGFRADNLEVQENTKQYCENFSRLKVCLADFYSKVADKVDSGRETNPKNAEGLEDFREDLSDAASQRE